MFRIRILTILSQIQKEDKKFCFAAFIFRHRNLQVGTGSLSVRNIFRNRNTTLNIFGEFKIVHTINSHDFKKQNSCHQYYYVNKNCLVRDLYSSSTVII
jgi:hypothetical protein